MENIRASVDLAITQALASTLPERADIDRDQPLSTGGGLDSIQVMNLVMEIEDHLDISVPVDLLAEAQTLNELAQKVTDLLESQG